VLGNDVDQRRDEQQPGREPFHPRELHAASKKKPARAGFSWI
jgi:hypothetical protein